MAKKNDNPKNNLARMERIEEAWASLAQDEIFGEMTLTQFRAKIKPSKDSRANITRIEEELKGELVARDNDDAISLYDCDLVVKGVVANPRFGNNSALYGQMGYKRKSQYKTGMTRKLKVVLVS